jgi:pyruvate formate-lyase activating enzyme-like uncharacterized protein
LEAFCANKLSANQIEYKENNAQELISKLFEILSTTVIAVSSAYNTHLTVVVTEDISLTYILYNKGPKIDP